MGAARPGLDPGRQTGFNLGCRREVADRRQPRLRPMLAECVRPLVVPGLPRRLVRPPNWAIPPQKHFTLPPFHRLTRADQPAAAERTRRAHQHTVPPAALRHVHHLLLRRAAQERQPILGRGQPLAGLERREIVRHRHDHYSRQWLAGRNDVDRPPAPNRFGSPQCNESCPIELVKSITASSQPKTGLASHWLGPQQSPRHCSSGGMAMNALYRRIKAQSVQSALIGGSKSSPVTLLQLGELRGSVLLNERITKAKVKLVSQHFRPE